MGKLSIALAVITIILIAYADKLKHYCKLKKMDKEINKYEKL